MVFDENRGGLLALIAVASLFIFTSCLNDSLTADDKTRGGEPPGDTTNIESTDPVPADDTLEAVTWNLEWYGSMSNGPDDEDLQTQNIVTVLDSLDADLYAFEEVYSQGALNQIVKPLKGYHGFVASHINWVQKTAFVYNTATIDSVSSGGITEGQDKNDWANGRYPLYFQFNYAFKDTTIPFYAVVIHAKANTGNVVEKQEAYERRKRAAAELHQYLQERHSESRIILLGDFNDDVDYSIYDGSSPTPYNIFVSDETHFRVATKPLSELGKSSYVDGNYSDLIDHIVISDELFPWFIPSSPSIYFKALNVIPGYSTTTSDHLPVWAKFTIGQ